VESTDSNAFAHFASMTSINTQSHISYAVLNSAFGSWIIDTGASDHMTFDSNLFSHTTTLLSPVSVPLPDGTLKPVTITGDIPLSSTTLHNVLYVPNFKYNLLSVAKFLADDQHCTIFYPSYLCFLGPFN